MIKLISTSAWLLACFGFLALTGAAAETDTRCYEMRVYYAAPGKLEKLHARFRDHTVKLFEKHGITNIGYWVPVDNKDNKLIYVLAYPNREAREKAWKEFQADPEWKAAKDASEKEGKLVDKVDQIFMTATDYSPRPNPAGGVRSFELRVYTTNPGKQDALNARFRDHTLELFKKHGIANIAYWEPTDKEKGAGNTLIYIIAHQDRDAAKKSWTDFQADPVWKAARDASEKDGKILSKAPESTYMTATDYSPLK